MASSHSALFIIDIQKDLAACAQTEIPHAARIREVGDKILSAVQGFVAPPGKPAPLVVFVQYEEDPEDGPLVKGSEPWKLVFNPRASADDEILVAKRTRRPCQLTRSEAFINSR